MQWHFPNQYKQILKALQTGWVYFVITIFIYYVFKEEEDEKKKSLIPLAVIEIRMLNKKSILLDNNRIKRDHELNGNK